MTRRNITVSLPDKLVQEARHLAVDKGLSLSKYLALLLEEHIESTRRYRTARERQLQRLRQGVPLGTHGEFSCSASRLHEN